MIVDEKYTKQLTVLVITVLGTRRQHYTVHHTPNRNRGVRLSRTAFLANSRLRTMSDLRRSRRVGIGIDLWLACHSVESPGRGRSHEGMRCI
jgi:hypothetical protein